MSAEDAGSIYAEIRLGLDQMEKDALDAQKSIENFAKRLNQSGRNAGTEYVKGFGSTSRQLNSRLNTMVLNMNALGPRFGAAGARAAMLFSKPIFTMAPMVNAAFNSMLGFIGPIISAVQILGNVITSAFAKKNENARKAAEGLAEYRKELANIDRQARIGIITDKEKIENNIRITNNRWLQLENEKEILENKDNINRADRDAIKVIKAKQIGLEAYLENLNKTLIIVSKRVDYAEAEEKRIRAIRLAEEERRLGLITDLELTERKHRAQVAYYEDILLLSDKYGQKEDGYLERQSEQVILNREIARQLEIENVLKDINEKHSLAIADARRKESDGLITIIEMERLIEAAHVTRLNDLNSITDRYRLITGEVVNQRNAAASLVQINQDLIRRERLMLSLSEEVMQQQIEVYKASAVSADSEEKRQEALQKALDLELKLFDAQRKRAWEEIKNSTEYKSALREEQEIIEQKFLLITNARRNAIKAFYDTADQGIDKWEKITETINKYADAIGNMLNYISDIMSSFSALYSTKIKNMVDKEIRELERLHNTQLEFLKRSYAAQLEYLEKEKQAKLYAKGFIEAQTEEQHQRELELAIASGDHQRIFQAQNAHERFLIEQEYEQNKAALEQQAAEEKAAMEEAYAKRKAQLDHKVAVAQWKSEKINAAIAAAMTIARALAAPPGVPWNAAGVALATTLGAVQLAAVAATKPKLQSFSTGGIVAGNSFIGDNILARVNSDEMILTKEQQKRLFDLANGADSEINDQEIIIPITINLDGQKIAENTVNTYINNRKVLIKARSVIE
jgi:hypothetical protein